MVIFFSVPEARNQLLNEGVVYTFRWNKRKNVGKNWANKGRLTSKIADVYIDEPRLIESDSDLALYVSQSGFKNVKDWIAVIMSMNKQFNQMHGYLYKVTVLSQQVRTEEP